MSELEQEGRRLFAEMAEYLRKCGAGEAAEAHLAAMVAEVRPRVFTALISGTGDIRVTPAMLFGNRPDLALQAAAQRKLEYPALRVLRK